MSAKYLVRSPGPGELVVRVDAPLTPLAKRSRYVKVRDRAAFAFALESCAAAVEMKGNVIERARVALGGVATKPSRSEECERELEGRTASAAVFRAEAEAALKDAKAAPRQRVQGGARQTCRRAHAFGRDGGVVSPPITGKGVDRADARLKVTGKATDVAETQVANVV